LCVVLFINQSAFIFAQESVDAAELESNLTSVEFIDNTAAPSRIDTRQQILNIGDVLGLAIQGGSSVTGDVSRYFVIHRLHPSEFDKLDGDIFGIGANAEVDQIRNLRLIVQGYLEGAYAYSATDAALLAGYITIYNAVYRKNRVYFSGRYKTPLMDDLTAGKEGISLRWDEWPGNTLMVIPLQTARDGSLSAVDTTSITSGEVIEELRKDDDRGVEQRQQMVELKEREADEAAQKAAIQREEVTRDEQKIAEERRKAEEERQKIAEERQQVPEGSTPEEEAERQAALDEREEAVAGKEADTDELEKSVEEKKQEASENEELAERKTEEANAERAAISEDQREMIASANIPSQSADASGVLGLKLLERNSSIAAPVLVIPSSGEQLKTSALNTVRARSLIRANGRAFAVAGENGGDSVHRLVEIDAATLQTVKQGADEINTESLIWVNGSNLYAIVNADGQQYLARFNMDLAKQAQSPAPVHPFATVMFEGGRLLTQNAQGAVAALDAQTLQ
jgi:hypothetical protein